MSSVAAAFGPEEPEKPDLEDDELPSQNPSGTGALAQGSNVPLGWKPTAEAPVPVVRCTQIKKDGVRCGRWSRRGATKCIKHGGNGGALKNVEEHRLAVIESARLRILDDTDLAVDALESLMDGSSGTADAIRLKAATEILDRAGIRGGFEIAVEADIIASPADELNKRLLELRKGAAAVQRIKADRDIESDDVVDADVVEDDPEQPGLFELGGSDDD